MLKNANSLLALSLVFVTSFSLLEISKVNGQGLIESEAATREEESSVDPVTLINQIRNLLSQANTSYINQDFVGAEQTVRTAYLDNYEYLEGPLAALNPQLMESTELLIREDLITAIQERASVEIIQAMMSVINYNLDKSETLFQ